MLLRDQRHFAGQRAGGGKRGLGEVGESASATAEVKIDFTAQLVGDAAQATRQMEGGVQAGLFPGGLGRPFSCV